MRQESLCFHWVDRILGTSTHTHACIELFSSISSMCYCQAIEKERFEGSNVEDVEIGHEREIHRDLILLSIPTEFTPHFLIS